METIRGYQALDRTLTHPVVTIGNFDGMHLGHQAIIREAIQQARKRQGVAVAYTFRPHPHVALRPDAQVQLLSTYDEKLELLSKFGIQLTVEEPFSRDFSIVPPEQFFTDALLRKIGAEAIVVGYDFAFGRERQGHLEALEGFCKKSGVELTIVSPQRMDGDVVSSSKIRQYLLGGDVERASHLLGHEFCYRGIVIRGEGRGRKLGFPTANLKLENKLALPYGVYATWAVTPSLGGGKPMPSVTNVGVRPTFGDGKELPALVETHVLDVNADLYGNPLEVCFVRRLREERKFSGVEELKTQIALDGKMAAQVLSTRAV